METSCRAAIGTGGRVEIAGRPAVRIPLDLPAERLIATIGAWSRPAILAGGPEFGAAGRWTILAAEPVFVHMAGPRRARTRFDRGRFDRPDRIVSHDADPFGQLDLLLSEYHEIESTETPPPGPDEPPFRGGFVGYLGYDLAPFLERLPRKAPPDSRLPLLHLGLYDTWVAVDHRTGEAAVWASDLIGDGRRALRRRAESWRDRLNAGPPPVRGSVRTSDVLPCRDRAEFVAAIGRALEYIRAGDIFQVNLSQRFEARGAFDPLDLFLRLRGRSPAPFSALYGLEGGAVVSASPEWFYQVRGARIVTRPIKGTRPRGRDEAEDARLVAELLASPKDRAELAMIVDLERNDLGRVCEYGSVRVTDECSIETYANVHHLVATVEGRLRAHLPREVAAAMFPGGSITGAPKIRAMEIIDELEPTRRGIYTGAIGYLSPGASAFNIAIRTLVIEGDRASYQVGGGIVVDSAPEAEYEETLHKGRALREVLESTETAR